MEAKFIKLPGYTEAKRAARAPQNTTVPVVWTASGEE
jgi:hypothetical protein